MNGSGAKVLVAGAGVSGLACARTLSEAARKRGVALSVTVLEASERSGGVVDSVLKDGFLLEKGPESFLSENPRTFELCRELGIEGELIGTQPLHRKTSIVHHGRLVPLPEGFYLIAPKNIPAFLSTPLFSPAGKLRMLAESVLPRKKDGSDESVASFVRRRFGREALERVGQPMIAGVYSGDPEKLSIQSTMPRFCRAEETFGSVLRGLKAPKETRGPRYSLFMSFKNGMKTLTDALEKALPPQTVRTGFRIAAVDRQPSGQWTVRSDKGETLTADALCLALSARGSSRLLGPIAPELSALLSRIRYESVATLNLAFEEDAIENPLDAFGFVVPRTEGLSLMACTFLHRKFAGRAGQGKALLRAFVGGAFGGENFLMPDEALERKVLADLGRLLGLRKKPLFSLLQRYPEALPQYEVGHTELLKDIASSSARLDGLALTGSSYRGTGIPDCIRDAEASAENILKSLGIAKISADK